MSIIWFYEISHVQLAACPSCVPKTSTLDITVYTQTVQPIFFMPVLLIGTTDCYHFYTTFTLCHDTCEPISLKLGMMLNTSTLYSLNDLDIHSRSQGYRKLKLVQSFYCKVA